MRADAINLYNYPVRTEMAGTKQIPTSRVCFTDEIIKRVPSKQNSITYLFYGQGRIKRHHRRKMFYGGR